MAHFTNKYTYHLETKFDTKAINFANQHDWTKEKIDNRIFSIDNFRFIGSNLNQTIDIYYDEDMDHYFFIKYTPVVKQNMFDKFMTWFINKFWNWFKK